MADDGLEAGLHFTWQSIIMTVGLFVVMAGGYWTLAYIPISNDIKELKRDHKELRQELVAAKQEATTRQDLQQTLNTTRLEFLAEIKRLDQRDEDVMRRKEFEAWKAERDKTIASIQDRQNRFTEALDAMYSRIMQQQPSYPKP